MARKSLKRYFFLSKHSTNTSSPLHDLMVAVEASESEGCELVKIVTETDFVSKCTNKAATHYRAVMRKPPE